MDVWVGFLHSVISRRRIDDYAAVQHKLIYIVLQAVNHPRSGLRAVSFH